MKSITPTLMDFDGVEIIAPNGWARFTGRQWGDIEAAMILAANDSRDAAAVVIFDLEERLGTYPAHRLALDVGPEAVRRDIGRANRKRQRLERNRVVALTAPWKPPGYEPKTLGKALRKADSNDPKQVKEAIAQLVDIEEAHRGRVETSRIAAEQAEVRIQAEARGETVAVETSPAKGYRDRIRILSRDGLEHLFVGGSLSPRQYIAGIRYRELYEKADWERCLKPTSPGTIKASHGGDGFAAKICQWRQEILNIEREVIERCQNRYALTVLQEVAGSRRSIRSMGGGGTLRAKQIAGLTMALDVCADEFGVSDGRY